MSVLERIIRTVAALLLGAALGLGAGLLGVGIADWTGWKPRDLEGLAAVVLCVFTALIGGLCAPISVWLRRLGPLLGLLVPMGLVGYCLLGGGFRDREIPFALGGSLGMILAGTLSGLLGRYLGRPRPSPMKPLEVEPPEPFVPATKQPSYDISACRPHPLTAHFGQPTTTVPL